MKITVIVIDIDNNPIPTTGSMLIELTKKVANIKRTEPDTEIKLFLRSRKFHIFYVLLHMNLLHFAFEAIGLSQKSNKISEYAFAIKDCKLSLVNQRNPSMTYQVRTGENEEIKLLYEKLYTTKNKGCQVEVNVVDYFPVSPKLQLPTNNITNNIYLMALDIDNTFTPIHPEIMRQFIELVKSIQEKLHIKVKICFISRRPCNYARALMDAVSQAFAEEGIYDIVDYSACEHGAVIINKCDTNSVPERLPVKCGKEDKELIRSIIDYIEKNLKDKLFCQNIDREYTCKILPVENIPFQELWTLISSIIKTLGHENRINIQPLNTTVEIMPSQTGKGHALQNIIEIYKSTGYYLSVVSYSGDDSRGDIDAVNFVRREAKLILQKALRGAEYTPNFHVFLPHNAHPSLMVESDDVLQNYIGTTKKGSEDYLCGIIELIKRCLLEGMLLTKGSSPESHLLSLQENYNTSRKFRDDYLIEMLKRQISKYGLNATGKFPTKYNAMNRDGFSDLLI